MSLNTVSYDLAPVYERAVNATAPGDVPAVRRAFRRALRAAECGDIRPAVLLAHRYP